MCHGSRSVLVCLVPPLPSSNWIVAWLRNGPPNHWKTEERFGSTGHRAITNNFARWQLFTFHSLRARATHLFLLFVCFSHLVLSPSRSSHFRLALSPCLLFKLDFNFTFVALVPGLPLFIAVFPGAWHTRVLVSQCALPAAARRFVFTFTLPGLSRLSCLGPGLITPENKQSAPGGLSCLSTSSASRSHLSFATKHPLKPRP